MARMKKDGTPAKKPGRKPKTTEPTLAEAMQGMQDAVDMFDNACEDMGLNVEEKTVTPLQPAEVDGFTVNGIQGLFGRYLRYEIGEKTYIDYTDNEGQELSMTAEQWVSFVAEISRAFEALGVRFP